jgi:hypothetical protein
MQAGAACLEFVRQCVAFVDIHAHGLLAKPIFRAPIVLPTARVRGVTLLQKSP